MNNFLRLYNLIIYSGMGAIIFMVITFLLGITGYNFKLHVLMAWIALGFAVIHATLILYKQIKIWQNKSKKGA